MDEKRIKELALKLVMDEQIDLDPSSIACKIKSLAKTTGIPEEEWLEFIKVTSKKKIDDICQRAIELASKMSEA